MRSASRLRDRFCAFIASAICQASTSLIATASNSSRLRSCVKKSSRVVKLFGERPAFLFLRGSRERKFTLASMRERDVLDRCLLRFLDEPMDHHDFALHDAEQHPCNPPTRKVAAHFPETLTQRAAQPHPHGPPVLDAHQV